MNESPKERTYALCEEMGLEQAIYYIETQFKGEELGYAKQWLKEHQQSEILLGAAIKSASSSRWSAIAATASAIVAIIALLPLLKSFFFPNE